MTSACVCVMACATLALASGSKSKLIPPPTLGHQYQNEDRNLIDETPPPILR